MTIDAPDDLAGLELAPLVERERWQLASALLGAFELLWPEIGDLLGVSLADRYGLMDNAQRRDVSDQILWLLQLLVPDSEES